MMEVGVTHGPGIFPVRCKLTLLVDSRYRDHLIQGARKAIFNRMYEQCTELGEGYLVGFSKLRVRENGEASQFSGCFSSMIATKIKAKFSMFRPHPGILLRAQVQSNLASDCRNRILKCIVFETFIATVQGEDIKENVQNGEWITFKLTEAINDGPILHMRGELCHGGDDEANSSLVLSVMDTSTNSSTVYTKRKIQQEEEEEDTSNKRNRPEEAEDKEPEPEKGGLGNVSMHIPADISCIQPPVPGSPKKGPSSSEVILDSPLKKKATAGSSTLAQVSKTANTTTVPEGFERVENVSAKNPKIKWYTFKCLATGKIIRSRTKLNEYISNASKSHSSGTGTPIRGQTSIKDFYTDKAVESSLAHNTVLEATSRNSGNSAVSPSGLSYYESKTAEVANSWALNSNGGLDQNCASRYFQKLGEVKRILAQHSSPEKTASAAAVSGKKAKKSSKVPNGGKENIVPELMTEDEPVRMAVRTVKSPATEAVGVEKNVQVEETVGGNAIYQLNSTGLISERIEKTPANSGLTNLEQSKLVDEMRAKLNKSKKKKAKDKKLNKSSGFL